MSTQITPLVEQAVVERMRAKASFTALDISNTLKAERYPIKHGDVAGVVRDIYASGAMDFYDFDCRLIDVVTDEGTKKAKAFLYLHDGTRDRDYTARSQTALPPVVATQARDLSEAVAALPAVLLPRPQRPSRPRGGHPSRPRTRRDGALAVPRALVAQLGWSDGDTLALQAETNSLTLAPSADGNVRVWGGQRIRVCQRKLRVGALTAGATTVEIDGDGLRIKAK